MAARILRILGILAVAPLAACGGGGGSGGGPITPGVGEATITTANAPDIAGGVAAVALSSDIVGDLASGSPVSATNSGIEMGVNSALRALTLIPKQKALGSQGLLSIPIPPTTVPCAVDGSLTLSGDIDDPNTLTQGDTFSISFAACDDGEGEVLDGSFTMTVQTFTGDLTGGAFNLAVSITVSNLQVTVGVDVTVINGNMGSDFDSSQFPSVSVSVTADVFTVTENGLTETLSDYRVTETADEGVFPSPYTMDTAGTYTSSDVTGNVTFSTPVIFQGTGEEYPSIGELFIRGAENASIRLVALDNINVRIDVDTDGDGVVDAMIDSTWDEVTSE